MLATKFSVKRGDVVIAITGKNKGKSGKVLRVMRKENRLIVEGINMVKRHKRPVGKEPGGIVTKEAPIHISNVKVTEAAKSGPVKRPASSAPADKVEKAAAR